MGQRGAVDRGTAEPPAEECKSAATSTVSPHDRRLFISLGLSLLLLLVAGVWTGQLYHIMGTGWALVVGMLLAVSSYLSFVRAVTVPVN